MNEQELMEIIKNGRETRNIEYKRSMPWGNIDNREKLIRTILAMSNIRDGGFIVIGMDKQRDNSYIASGITKEDRASYNEDNMADVVSEFADPYTIFSIRNIKCDGKEFLFIQVDEFEATMINVYNEISDMIEAIEDSTGVEIIEDDETKIELLWEAVNLVIEELEAIKADREE